MDYPAGSLEGKVVIITGAASGMGRAAALLGAARGAAVVAADLNADGAEAIVRDHGQLMRQLWTENEVIAAS
jgi:NAD(P)-dependent dehydrogenase (short-subunit alcohol dehydrogenase family)